ncbi:probable Pescadillo homolog [Saccharomycodes ludwigii]|uniref:Pescadillo homolog n=1 Tax=Saccharomycodes ludwigii TaxID=36035 RepID=A0A376BBS9_9ASCO|nr:hypothetical protein SCDLUD_002316 [Saccharomycodes ludwigii]KAH3900861.1 hypothetical protein SCDLUD_002316 [Saccharomycodes ludwigii]SSD62076.1 probable Pescadillo homolog [Saccharomycodes ludwigii]
MRIKKKNTSGNAHNFITRTQAVRKLQLSLADFRRLCIFKGIYPREPRNKKKANKGSTAPVTFYYTKDIQYLMHEPILAKFREHKTFIKKVTKALGKGQVNTASKLESKRPQYTLDHVIKERYPSFPEALRDIDDALNMLFLFANLPATDKITSKVTQEATKLTNQWLAYVARERLVQKVFVSIKGVYYSATVKGEEIRWIVPYKFPENIPNDVDFRIMLTFLEFYSTLVHFVLYKLYHDAGLVYPPTLDLNKEKSIGGLSSYVLEENKGDATNVAKVTGVVLSSKENARKLDAVTLQDAMNADSKSEKLTEQIKDDYKDENPAETELDVFEDNNKNKGDVLEQPSKYSSPTSILFKNFVFYIGREVPIDILEFLILSCGGKVIIEAELDQLEDKSKIDLSNITHQICDRPIIKNKVVGRTYVQPQWVFDSINKGELVSANLYLPGETLPPHLSPWGDSVGYDPLAEEEEQQDEEEGEEEEEEGDISEDDKGGEEIEDDVDEDLVAQKELELEAKGVAYSDVKDKLLPSKKRKVAEDGDEDKDLKLIMMSNKQRKLYKKMQYSNNQKEERVETLKKKKKEIAKKKKQLKNSK